MTSHEDQGTAYDSGAAAHERQGRAAAPNTIAGDFDRAEKFAREWGRSAYDPEQHPEWLNLTRAFLRLRREAEATEALARDRLERIRPLYIAARDVVEHATQDVDGRWIIAGDGEALLAALQEATHRA
jgi:hypothetical protein